MRKFEMKYFKMMVIFFLLLHLLGCAKRLAPQRTEAEQQYVKQQVMQLLEQEYQQPFQLERFKYEYKTQYPNASGNRPYTTFGVFTFTVKAVTNPIIKFNFTINDNNEVSVNELIDTFKKSQLKRLYCGIGLVGYYEYINNNNNKKVKEPYIEEAEKYCSSIGQNRYKLYKEYYLKHQKNES